MLAAFKIVRLLNCVKLWVNRKQIMMEKLFPDPFLKNQNWHISGSIV